MWGVQVDSKGRKIILRVVGGHVCLGNKDQEKGFQGVEIEISR